MDPQQLWQDIVDFTHDIDIEDIDPLAGVDPDDVVRMIENIRNLNEWLRKGGFAPRYAQPTKEVEAEIAAAEDKNEHPWDRRRYR